MLHDAQDSTLFPRLAEEDVLALAAVGAEVILAAGETLFTEDALPEDFFVVLAGRLTVSKRVDGQDTVLAEHRRGEFTGDVSLVTGQRVTATATAAQDSRVCRIAGEDFSATMARFPRVAEAVFRAVASRAQDLGAQVQQSARLAALNTLAAGLAHELDNPASAARRGTVQLQVAVPQLAHLGLELGTLDLGDEARRRVIETLAQERAAPVLSPLDRADREDALTTWLEGRGVPDALDLAPTLLELNFSEDALAAWSEGMNAGQLGVALRLLGATHEARTLADEAQQALTRISAVVDAMKAYTFMDRAPQQDLDVRASLDSTLAVLGSRLPPGITVVREYGAGVPPVPARGAELTQVWTNLIDNALDALGERGTLRLQVVREGDAVLVEVGDDGPGIPEALQERVFDAFFTTKDVGGGAGLGLDVARRVVRAHGGELRVTSRPGDTRFTVRLPLGADGRTEGARWT
ncbi:sensor histidine kinase (plasmid) [Deinococcus aetherius]|uniref:histidine kinase n=1 Tax=Deinococcus aetherius TaxID=200252 RepID=A0ABN6RMX1_9DEIO|nr:ATP-binding protein [Deinococcus aetherius]BDP43686.1 sensor histidine kinase [Deinococcus aetherius]